MHAKYSDVPVGQNLPNHIGQGIQRGTPSAIIARQFKPGVILIGPFAVRAVDEIKRHDVSIHDTPRGSRHRGSCIKFR